jgi:single-strand DNA-binding protein
MNVLSAIGNINNPELRFLSDQTPVLQFSFALNSGYGDKQVTTWLNCSLFGKRAQTLAPMLAKGNKVGITGELTNRPYIAKDGSEKHSLELRINDLTLLTPKSDSNTQPAQNNAPKAHKIGADPMDFEDDIPF